MPLLDSRRTTSTVRMIARCSQRGCRAATSAIVEVDRTTNTYGLPTGSGLRTERHETLRVVEGAWTNFAPSGRRSVVVPNDPCGHGRMTSGSAIRGRVTDAACNARCEGAIKAECECSCGGANHGRAHQ